MGRADGGAHTPCCETLGPVGSRPRFQSRRPTRNRIVPMLMTVVIVMLVLWALGLVSGHTMGGLVNVLLVAAVVVLLVRVINGRRVL